MSSNENSSYEKLLKSERMLRLIFDNASVGIPIVDKKGNFLRVNKKMQEMLGYTESELLKLDVKSITHPEDDIKTRQTFVEFFEGKRKSLDSEKRYIRKDGTTVHARTRAFIIPDEEGEEVIFAMMEDRSQQVHAEQNLKEMYQIFISMLDNLSIVVNQIDDKGNFTKSLGSGLKKMGLEENELVGKNVFKDFDHIEEFIRCGLKGEVVVYEDKGNHNGQDWRFQNFLLPNTKNGDGVINLGIEITNLKD